MRGAPQRRHQEAAGHADYGKEGTVARPLATGIGGIPVLLGGRLPHRVFDGLVGFAAGAMIAISGHEIGAGLADERVVTLVAASLAGLAVLGVRAAPRALGPTTSRRLNRGSPVALVVNSTTSSRA